MHFFYKENTKPVLRQEPQYILNNHDQDLNTNNQDLIAKHYELKMRNEEYNSPIWFDLQRGAFISLFSK